MLQPARFPSLRSLTTSRCLHPYRALRHGRIREMQRTVQTNAAEKSTASTPSSPAQGSDATFVPPDSPAAEAIEIAASGQRKPRTKKPVFYAVAVGNETGVFTDYFGEVLPAMKGHLRAMYCKFDTELEAVKWLDKVEKGQKTVLLPDPKGGQFYAVLVYDGPHTDDTGIYTDWYTEVRPRVIGGKFCEYKRFRTEKAAQEWLDATTEIREEKAVAKAEEAAAIAAEKAKAAEVRAAARAKGKAKPSDIPDKAAAKAAAKAEELQEAAAKVRAARGSAKRVLSSKMKAQMDAPAPVMDTSGKDGAAKPRMGKEDEAPAKPLKRVQKKASKVNGP